MGEEHPTAREDQGYNTKNSSVLLFQKYQKPSVRGTLQSYEKLPEDKIRIEYIRGMAMGGVVVMARRYADPVISRGYAREI